MRIASTRVILLVATNGTVQFLLALRTHSTDRGILDRVGQTMQSDSQLPTLPSTYI